MENAIVKQAAGIDIAMENFEVCLATLDAGGRITYSKFLISTNIFILKDCSMATNSSSGCVE